MSWCKGVTQYRNDLPDWDGSEMSSQILWWAQGLSWNLLRKEIGIYESAESTVSKSISIRDAIFHTASLSNWFLQSYICKRPDTEYSSACFLPLYYWHTTDFDNIRQHFLEAWKLWDLQENKQSVKWVLNCWLDHFGDRSCIIIWRDIISSHWSRPPRILRICHRWHSETIRAWPIAVRVDNHTDKEMYCSLRAVSAPGSREIQIFLICLCLQFMQAQNLLFVYIDTRKPGFPSARRGRHVRKNRKETAMLQI